MEHTNYQTTELPCRQTERDRFSLVVPFVVIAIVSCIFTYEFASQGGVRNFVASVLPRAQTIARPSAIYAARKEGDGPLKLQTPSFFAAAAPKAPPPAPKKDETALENVGRIAGVGAKVVSELALYLAFNTAYFVSNTYKFLTEEEQKNLAKQTVDKQLPELLALLGGTTDTLGKTAATVAETAEYKELQQSAAQAVEELTKGLKTDGTSTASPEVIENLKKIVADDKGEVLSEERKSAILETLKKGGVKGTELSLYLFYNVFSVLRNLDKVLPTAEQTGSIEGKIEDLEEKIISLADQVKDLPSQSGKITEKVEELKESIPTAEDLANLDPAEVSLSVRSALATAKDKLDEAVEGINKAIKPDSEFRKTLDDASIKLKPVTDAVGAAVSKLPLPKNADGSVDYSKLLADAGIITVKGLKALIEATKKAASSVNAKTEN